MRSLFAVFLCIAGWLPAAEPPPGWKLALAETGSADWTARWFLDGKLAAVRTAPGGLILRSGPIAAQDAGHAVLWTKDSFAGELRIEYDFTRLDANREHTSVCILYFHATGLGTPEFPADIFAWRDRREVPAMSLYFKNMHAYHLSYACTGGEDADYIRARCYPTKGSFQKDTLIAPSYGDVHLFATGETWHLVTEYTDHTITLTATRGSETHAWKWDSASFAPLHAGRIGLRQMRGRESHYANFKVFVRP